MDDTQAREHCWQQVKASLEQEKWTAGDSAAFHAFFNYGWCAAKAWESHMASECQRMADEIERLRAALEQISTLRGLQHPITMMIAEDRISARHIARDALHPPNTPPMPPTPAKDAPMTPELKLCPFCGGKASMVRGDHVTGHPRWYKVYCTGCQNRTWEHPRKKNAVAAWNTRAT